jgi:hypothetical protein
MRFVVLGRCSRLLYNKMPSSQWLLPVLALFAAYLYSSPPEFLHSEKATRAPLTKSASPNTITTQANKAYFTSANYQFNFTTPQFISYTIQIQLNGNVQFDITSASNCQTISNTTDSGVAYNCLYQIPSYISPASGYAVVINGPAPAYTVTGNVFAITCKTPSLNRHC